MREHTRNLPIQLSRVHLHIPFIANNIASIKYTRKLLPLLAKAGFRFSSSLAKRGAFSIGGDEGCENILAICQSN